MLGGRRLRVSPPLPSVALRAPREGVPLRMVLCPLAPRPLPSGLVAEAPRPLTERLEQVALLLGERDHTFGHAQCILRLAALFLMHGRQALRHRADALDGLRDLPPAA